MVKQLVILLLITITLASQAPTQIDVVQNLLKDLKDNAKNELDLLDSSWSQNSARKQSTIQALTQSLTSQRGVCQNRDIDVQNKERDIQITNNYIGWLDKRIKANNNRIAVLDYNRCDSNSNYINHLKNNKMILNIIRFLRNALLKANENNLPALLQTEEFQLNLGSFIQITKDDQTLKQFQLEESLLQKKRTLNAEEKEIKAESQGFAHLIASDSQTFTKARSVFERKKINNFFQELLDLLDGMEQEVQNQVTGAQDLQVKSAMGLNDFKGLLHKENDTFEHYLLQETDNLVCFRMINQVNQIKLQNQLTTAIQNSESCKARLQQMSQSLEFANEVITKYEVNIQDYTSAEDNYKNVRERLLSEVDLFGDVSRIYGTQVGSQSSDYKKNVDQKMRQ